ncbi:MAG: response regulator transcription factor [Betaproteobacteria bacterium]|nr:response regulator transcription factor [Betaproteobacteria bacterium]
MRPKTTRATPLADPNAPRVFVIDDEESVRHSLTWLLNSISLKVEEFSSAQQFLDANISCEYGCLIVDVRMPNMSGLQLQKELLERGFQLPLIFLSAYGDGHMGAQAIKNGAIDFLQKPYQNQDLLDAVNAALKLSKGQMESKNKKLDYFDKFDSLSQREKEILSLVVDGKTSKEIAQTLKISPKTVEAHRASFLRKLGAKSASSVVHLAVHSNSHCRDCEWLPLPNTE